ncbi:MAG: hypothetical protein Q7K55_03355 [Candidatus Levybacteria bacterium]|nr:hypothetical protein [Candidatus Levybacteria bacterium]
MKKEKIVLSFIAVVAGLLVAGIAFYLYQQTKVIPKEVKTKVITIQPSVSPTPNLPSIFLEVDSPKDESVTDKKIVKVSGKTLKDALIVVSTNIDDDVMPPSANGDFSTTVNIEDGQNQIEITAISPDGQEKKVLRTVTFSTENF